MHASEWPANKPNIIFLSTYTIYNAANTSTYYVWAINYFYDSCTYLKCIYILLLTITGHIIVAWLFLGSCYFA